MHHAALHLISLIITSNPDTYLIGDSHTKRTSIYKTQPQFYKHKKVAYTQLRIY